MAITVKPILQLNESLYLILAINVWIAVAIVTKLMIAKEHKGDISYRTQENFGREKIDES